MQKRLIFEEFFLIQVGLAFKRRHIPKTVGRGRAFKTRGPLIGKFMKLLKFELTQAQKNESSVKSWTTWSRTNP